MTQDDEHLIAEARETVAELIRREGRGFFPQPVITRLADRLQSAPKPSLPSREGAKPKHFSQMLGAFRGLDEPDPIFSETSPSPLSDRVERLEAAEDAVIACLQRRSFGWIIASTAAMDDAINALLEARSRARAALGDGERG